MVKGLIINKFRGDKSILDPGIEMLKDYTPVPVVGVVPYMHVDIDDEDSLADRLDEHTEKGLIDIAVIRVPRMSNFTDFNALERMQGVTLRYVEKVQQLGRPDLILLPGTKNTMGDLKWLRHERSGGFGFEIGSGRYAGDGHLRRLSDAWSERWKTRMAWRKAAACAAWNCCRYIRCLRRPRREPEFPERREHYDWTVAVVIRHGF